MISTLKLTDAGKSMLIRANAGENLTFTRFGIGSGILGSGMNADSLTSLIAEKLSFGISGVEAAENSLQIDGNFDTSMLTQSFTWRELGVYCKCGADAELLYAYVNYGDDAGTIHPQSDNMLMMQSISIIVAVGDAANVSAIVSPSSTYAPLLHQHTIGDIASAGQYTGNGAARREIALGFRPSAVYLCTDRGDTSHYGICGGLAVGNRGLRNLASDNILHANTWTDGYSALIITATGFTVGYHEGASSDDRVATNEDGRTYLYIAYR